jgi:hypothetical protein
MEGAGAKSGILKRQRRKCRAASGDLQFAAGRSVGQRKPCAGKAFEVDEITRNEIFHQSPGIGRFAALSMVSLLAGAAPIHKQGEEPARGA